MAGNAFGVIKEGGDKGVAEELALKASDAEMMFDIGGGFFEIEGPEVITDGQTLVESAEGSKAQLVGQVGLTEQDQGQLGGGVEVVIEQKAELVKEVRGELVGFVDDEQHEAALARQLEQGLAELRQETAEGVGRFNLQSPQDLGIERSWLEVGIGQINAGMESGVQGMGKGAQGG